MASNRDDFIIAIRSAFLKKSTQQKFSLLTLVFISIFVIFLSSLDLKIVRYLKIGIGEVVYRSSFVVSIPENFIKKSIKNVSEYTTFFKTYKRNQLEIKKLRSGNVSNEIIYNENKELKELIDDYVETSNKVLAKVIVDHQSPFLKSIIINKGSKDEIKIGTNIYDKAYLVGRVIEVNYKTSRVLLLSDLNSNVPVTIAPQNVQAIISGTGDDYGQIKYIKSGLSENFTDKSIIYTSGSGAIFKSGIPIGKIIVKSEQNLKWDVEFYSDFTQLKYVFAEVVSKKENTAKNEITVLNNNETKTSIDPKIKLLEDELKIIEMTNFKLSEESGNLKNQINILNNEISLKNTKIANQKDVIDQSNIDESELEFLRLNLTYSHRCRKSFLNAKGFRV
ncbi:rod shape-determining protein MreC, partial [Candidatus Pelagibacter sp.]|nr:rod shape-determining protein MreC [Candidatus Pelagibacter sp.]